MSRRGHCIRRSLSQKKRSGTLISSDRDRDHVVQSDTAQCCHCGWTWQHTPGSGRIRGWCMRCMGFVCGPNCVAGTNCITQEQILENIEAGRRLDTPPPVKVSTSGLIIPD